MNSRMRVGIQGIWWLNVEQGVSRIDNSYTLGYSLYIYCVFTQRRKPCATPLLIYGHCPRSET
jgi:hypothetical protein